MTAHTVTAYDQELKALENAIARMGGLAEQQLRLVLSAVTEADPEKAIKVIAGDQVIDAVQREVEEMTVQLIARRQPVAVDLRVVLGALRIASDLERIGDLAKSTAKRLAQFDEKAWLSPMTKSLTAIGDLAALQLKTVLDAYSQRNLDQALLVWNRDEEIDRQYNALFRELLTYMMEDPRTITFSAHLLFCAKNIERIGDHCTNIAEIAAYIITGEPLVENRPRADIAPVPSEG
ncbi:phosphate uptake regulator, PhoU [Rhodomicrobium vannielii ATCC 17100]|uniref:Phosphate-specific transport system accessory protein PhoU n=1 Tax=Rhodomicrobium vannielii (strain ATCC 17100 / DSM 162 / LMG 4299 / NCIMB 10020 / ATH 3.1.1) TaxID=648757 RepID=E3I006_RHOVT|nr:phosphate signaling complex protein PhoU [Rhodomicrobium vannielii]ADP69957.1 phosphate uptake regulator, PhoU [Rhodomicrobium vannielii ATCC 17100]